MSRVQPAILSMIYEYLKWVGMKNTCALLLCESPVKFETSFNFDSTNGSDPVPELCTYLSEKTARNEHSVLNGHGEMKTLLSSLMKTSSSMNNSLTTSPAVNNSSVNQTFLVSGSGEPPQTNAMSNINKTTAPPPTSPPSSSSVTNATQNPNSSNNSNNVISNNNTNNNNIASTTVPPPSKIPTLTGNLGSSTLGGNSVNNSPCPSDSNDESESTPTNNGNATDKTKVYTAQYEKNVSESIKKSYKSTSSSSAEKELKPSNSDQSLQQKSKEQLQFGFLSEKQKLEAFNKKFSGSELFPKKKSDSDEHVTATLDPSANKGNDSRGEKGIESSLKNNNNNINVNSASFEPDFDDESISDLHDSTADDVTQDLSIDSDSKVMAANAAECDHVLKLK